MSEDYNSKEIYNDLDEIETFLYFKDDFSNYNVKEKEFCNTGIKYIKVGEHQVIEENNNIFCSCEYKMCANKYLFCKKININK